MKITMDFSTITGMKFALRDASTSEGSNLMELGHMDIVSKCCAKCKVSKPLSEFYLRNSRPHSYCKSCITSVSKFHPALVVTQPKEQTEILAIEYLVSNGIPALPGKAIGYKFVDIVAFGCVTIEVKSSSLLQSVVTPHFKWSFNQTQRTRRQPPDIIMLICEHGGNDTFHLFTPDNPVFYINGRFKTGLTFTPGATEARKFGATRVVMTQPMMDEAQDRVQLIHDALTTYCEQLKRGA